MSMSASQGPPYNAAGDLLGRNIGADRGDRPYLITDGRVWTYQEIAAQADGVGVGLLDLGLEVGNRVVLATRDRPEFVASFWGAIKAGLVAVPVAQGLSTSDLDFILTDSEARVIVCDESSAEAAAPAALRAGVACLYVGDGRLDGARSWREVCGRPASLPTAPTTEEDIALWLYTSGTTGLPKAVMHRHRHLKAAPGALSAQVLGMSTEDVILSVSKMFFAYGLGNSVYLPAAAGATVVVNEGPVLPALVQELLDRNHPTILFGVPAFFGGYRRLADAKLPSSVRAIVTAGEVLSVDLFHGFQERFGVPLLDGLGATEALHHFTSNRPDDVVPGSAGRALDGYEVRALDRDLEPVPEGDGGELWVRGPTTFAGYWRRPELTARAYLDGWMRTGDLVRIIDGRVFHEGRLDDLIKLGGVWVAPSEVEDVLRAHPDVAEAAVVTTDEGTGVPTLKAFVVSGRDDRGLARELSRHCRRRLASFKVPQAFEIVPELPRTPSGKLRRFVLRGETADAAADAG
jgi:benzoate-CoA ligase family protein